MDSVGMPELYCSCDNQLYCNFIGSTIIPIEFTRSGPKSLDLPPPHACIPKAITCWRVAKTKFTRLCSSQETLLHDMYCWCIRVVSMHVPDSHRCSEELDLTRILKRELACAALMQTPWGGCSSQSAWGTAAKTSKPACESQSAFHLLQPALVDWQYGFSVGLLWFLPEQDHFDALFSPYINILNPFITCPISEQLYTTYSTRLPWYTYYMSQRLGVCTLLGNNKRCILSTCVLSVHVLILQDDKLYWYITYPQAIAKVQSLLADTVWDCKT